MTKMAPAFIFLLFFLAVALYSCAPEPGVAGESARAQLVYVVMKEASNQNNLGMVAVAWCMKNRADAGMSMGVGDLTDKKLAKRLENESRRTWARAEDAVDKVLTGGIFDVTNGAVFYENVKAFGVPVYITKALARGEVEQCAEIGDHIFWRYVKNKK